MFFREFVLELEHSLDLAVETIGPDVMGGEDRPSLLAPVAIQLFQARPAFLDQTAPGRAAAGPDPGNRAARAPGHLQISMSARAGACNPGRMPAR
jgi:hypothetical protein